LNPRPPLADVEQTVDKEAIEVLVAPAEGRLELLAWKHPAISAHVGEPIADEENWLVP
jgi:hypothetical protein